MGYFRMPVFVWTAWAAQTLQLIGLPALTGGAIMLLFDLSFGTSFFRPEGGGDPDLFFQLSLTQRRTRCTYVVSAGRSRGRAKGAARLVLRALTTANP